MLFTEQALKPEILYENFSTLLAGNELNKNLMCLIELILFCQTNYNSFSNYEKGPPIMTVCKIWKAFKTL